MQKNGKPDRYVSFAGIDGDGNARELMAMVLRHINAGEKTNLFWEQFKGKLARVVKPEENGGRCLDELFLIHSYINNIRVLFERYEDWPAMALLEKIEEESC